MPRRYSTASRQAQTSATQRRILEAVEELVLEAGPDGAVATFASVTSLELRTTRKTLSPLFQISSRNFLGDTMMHPVEASPVLLSPWI